MSVQGEPHAGTAPSLHAEISRSIVQLLRQYTGRGPTKANTTIRDNVILVMLEQTLTRGEQALVDAGREEKVLEIRKAFQDSMTPACSARVAELTGRGVLAMMSANHINPDLAAEVFVLDGPPDPSTRFPLTSDGRPEQDGAAVG